MEDNVEALQARKAKVDIISSPKRRTPREQALEERGPKRANEKDGA